MQRRRMEEFVPLHLNALERSPGLQTWLKAATRGVDPEYLTTSDWFTRGQGSGNFIWAPAPAAADVVVEQLGKARHKHPTSLHIVVVPRLMTGLWRRHLTRECDCYFRIPAGAKIWGKTQYEPVLIFVCLPLSRHRPWKLQGTKLLDGFERKVRELHKTNSRFRGRLLRKLFVQTRVLESLPDRLVRSMLQRAGEHPGPDRTARKLSPIHL